ncbi:MAG: EAL domain-containing protein [Cyanobacteria bacterium RI_101]|nr:EAL domain-containing protein [Cyanobacteria bacterium RI_101]
MTTSPDFRHIFVIEDQKARRIIALDEPTYSIGRESSNDIVIYDRVVSRHHATLVRIKPNPKSESYSYRIIDGDLEGNRSTNGLIINGQNAFTHDLKHGDVILFGSESKASYYIVSTSLEIALFNPLEISQYEEVGRPYSEEDSKSTIINDEEDISKVTQASMDLVRFSSFAELSPHPIVEMDFTGKIIYLNPPASIKFKTIQQEGLDHPVLTGLLNQVQNVRGNLLLREIQVKEEIYEQYVHYLAETQVIRSYLCDVTQRKQAEKSLAQQTFYDALTGLPNRGLFEEQLAIALAKANRDNTPVAALFLNFANYSRMINAFGLDSSDFLLKTVAQRLSEALGADGLVCRWQGEEFVILLKSSPSPEQIRAVAENILQTLQGIIEVSGQSLHLKGRLGIALYPQDGADAATLLKNAHTALEQIEPQNSSAYAFFNPKLASKANLLFRLENLLYEALDKRQFYLTYQPFIRVSTSQITGVEALLRWRHPELGEISPVNLIPLAEKTDLIVPIGQWILETACRQNKALQDQGIPPLPVTVNLSTRQFKQGDLVASVAETLEKTGLEPKWLTLEVTETAIMDDPSYSQTILQQLRELGVNLSLDDFGVGLGSLSCLQQFAIQTLKIHESFIVNLVNQPKNQSIVRALLLLGQSLRIRIIAEGVETLEQVERLRELKCEEVQGYWFSHPLKIAELTQFLSQSSIQ